MVSITLESVEESFHQWRSQRISRAEPIPERLWTMVLSLYPQYNRSKICRQLRLSGRQFKQRLESGCPSSSDNGFVLASRDEVRANAKPTTDVKITIQGKERTLTLCVGLNSLEQVLPQLGVLL